MVLFSVNLFLSSFLSFLLFLFFLALPHTSSYSLMMGGLGSGASLQKAQSLIDLGSSRYEGLKPPTFYAFIKECLQMTFFFFASSELIQVLLYNGQM